MATGDSLQVRATQEPECDEFDDPALTDARVAPPKDTALTPYAEASKNSSQSTGSLPTPFGPARRR